MADLQTLAAPVDAGNPCGPDLGDSVALLELERRAAGTPPQRMGWSVRRGRAPDWTAVAAGATAWLARSKDWRVALLLVRAWLQLEGWQGLQRGLALLLELWTRYGREVHPRPDDDWPDGWWTDTAPRDGTTVVEHPLLAEVGALGVGDGVFTVAEIERLQEQGLLGAAWVHDAAPAHRALDAELAAEPALPALLEAALASIDALADAIEGQAQTPPPHTLLSRLRRRLGRLKEALRSRLGEADDDLAGPAAEPPMQAPAQAGASTPPLPLERLTEPLSLDSPCGPDLEYDPEHLKLMQMAAWMPEREFSGFFEPARPPDWTGVYRQALDLFRRTRDLRVAAVLACAAAATGGWRGALEGMQLVVGLVEHLWDTVHPMLEPDLEDTAMMRVNALAELASPRGFLGELRRLESGSGMECEPDLAGPLQELQALVDRLRTLIVERTDRGDDPLRPLAEFLAAKPLGAESAADAPVAAPEAEVPTPPEELPPAAFEPDPATLRTAHELVVRLQAWLEAPSP